jgi:Holliday junction resolvasome RuvABC endonuclease subunit
MECLNKEHMKHQITIGIDPGASGAIAWIDERGKSCVEKMPDTLQDLWELIRDITNFPRSAIDGRRYKAYIEQVSSSPQMGVVSAFSFGRGYGNLEMALTAAGIPFERVRPQVWQKAMGCMTKGDKNISKAKAQELFPDKKVIHATADALLIALYGTKQQ